MAPTKTKEQVVVSTSRWGDIYEEIKHKYLSTTNRKLMLIDMFIAFSLIIAVLQIVYGFLSGRHPYNNFIGGVFCALGHAVLCLCLRLQCANPKDFGNITAESAFSGYIVGTLLLFFISVTVFEKYD